MTYPSGSVKVVPQNTYNLINSDDEIILKFKIKPTSLSALFEYSSARKITFENFQIEDVETMELMFYNCIYCISLTQLDLSQWDVSKVTNIYSMFSGCSALAQLDISNWDTSNVTKMNSMFYSCTSLTQINVSLWDTSNVNLMNDMFSGCSALNQFDASNWNTSKVTNMKGMFYNCQKLKDLNIESFIQNQTYSYYAMN